MFQAGGVVHEHSGIKYRSIGKKYKQELHNGNSEQLGKLLFTELDCCRSAVAVC